LSKIKLSEFFIPGKNVQIYVIILARDSGTGVEQLPHHPKVKGLCPTSAGGTRRQKKVRKKKVEVIL